jgi:hypothetical protein
MLTGKKINHTDYRRAVMAKGKGKSAVIEDLDDDLELVEDEEEAPKSKKGKAKASTEPKAESTSTGMGASWLAEHVNEELGTEYTAANIRVILRKMAADGDLEREVGTDRARYQFTGEKDPTVRAVLKRVRSGEADTAKADRIEAARSGKSSKGRVKDEDNGEDETPATKPKRGRRKSEDSEEETAKPTAARRRRTAE